jgi:hypothetical protein
MTATMPNAGPASSKGATTRRRGRAIRDADGSPAGHAEGVPEPLPEMARLPVPGVAAERENADPFGRFTGGSQSLSWMGSI